MPIQHPDQLHDLFFALANAHDLDGIMEMYEPTCVGVDLEGNIVNGAAEMRAFLAGFLSVLKKIEGSTRKLILRGDTALLSSEWRAVIATPEGEVSARGTSAEVLRRQPDGSWRVIVDDPVFVTAAQE